ncbi:MAG TPA: HD domain-containing phosphohydrolase [Gemmatimonadaceae bacterium]
MSPVQKKTTARRSKRRKPAVTLPLSEILAPLSRALDLTEGHALGHSLRACIIGMRLGQAAELDDQQLAQLYYTLLMKDAGGSANSSRTATLFGTDDHRVKTRMKFVDWQDRKERTVEVWRNTGRGRSLTARVGHFVGMARESNMRRDLVALRSARGSEVATRLGLGEPVAGAIHSIDEHWNGSGYPAGLRGDAIPLLSRIAAIAQAIELLSANGNTGAADDALRARRGEWFDPSLSDLARAVLDEHATWTGMTPDALDARVIALEPADHVRRVDEDALDEAAAVFADIIDGKSPYTVSHSLKVAEYARAIGAQLGLDARTQRKIYRAGLLHDLGMLGVSNRITEKAGTLTRAERAEIEHHPVHTLEILQRVPALAEVAMLAATHHEKLDGSGYPWGRTSEDLDLPARVLVVADVFVSATEDRAHRAGVTTEQALEILNAQRALWLDADAVDALAVCLEEPETRDL